MTEPGEADFNVPHETIASLSAFVALLTEENERQNLVSRASLENVWQRHILDSAQLVAHAPPGAATWVDLGTGAGFPGLVCAALHPASFLLIEARRLRCEFLRRAAQALGVEMRVEILCTRCEAVPPLRADVISARAFAPLDRLFALGAHLAGPETVWILPTGRNAKSELDAARASWQGEFRLEPSRTDADAQIIVARGVSRRAKGKRGR